MISTSAGDCGRQVGHARLLSRRASGATPEIGQRDAQTRTGRYPHRPNPGVRQLRLEDRLPEDQRNLAWRQRWRGGTVDFLVLKSMDVMTSNVHDFRERALRREIRDNDKLRERLSLTGRPYTWPELEGLLRLVRSVERADLPRSQRHALHRSLFLGRLPAQVNYLYFFSRLTRAKYREALAQDFHRGWATYDSGTPTPPWRRASAPGAVPATLGDRLA